MQKFSGEGLRGDALIQALRQRFRTPWEVVETEGSIQVQSSFLTLVYIYPYTAEWQDVATTGHHKLTWKEGLAVARAIQTLGPGPMSEIDKQRIRGVEILQELGFTWRDGRWHQPAEFSSVALEADAMHALLVNHADRLVGCIENSEDEEELERIGEAIEAYEAKRWPAGKAPGGKG